jgi:hypothetical protein
MKLNCFDQFSESNPDETFLKKLMKRFFTLKKKRCLTFKLKRYLTSYMKRKQTSTHVSRTKREKRNVTPSMTQRV